MAAKLKKVTSLQYVSAAFHSILMKFGTLMLILIPRMVALPKTETKNRFTNPRWRTDTILEIVVRLYFNAILSN